MVLFSWSDVALLIDSKLSRFVRDAVLVGRLFHCTTAKRKTSISPSIELSESQWLSCLRILIEG